MQIVALLSEIFEISKLGEPKVYLGFHINRDRDSKIVFKRKYEQDGSIRYKARLVARGFKDNNDYVLCEIYA